MNININRVKIILIIIGVLIGLILLDTIQARIFKNSPIISWKEKLEDSDSWVDRGILMDTYYCTREQDIQNVSWKFKGTKFTCPIDNEETTYNVTEIENVSVNIFDISLTGATIIIKDTNEPPHTYGSWYKIEKEVNGKWYELKTIIDDYAWTSIAYLPDENNEVKFKIDWEWLYGELPLGSYRILKEVGHQYISIEFGIATTSSSKIEVIKPEYHNDIKFNKYLERDGRTIYLAGNLEEVFYYTDSNTKITLKDHITKAYQTTDDSIKELTDLMTHTGTLKDGGTTIHKSSEYDITIIKCNTIAGNKNIFIGDYSMEFDNESMCK